MEAKSRDPGPNMEAESRVRVQQKAVCAPDTLICLVCLVSCTRWRVL